MYASSTGRSVSALGRPCAIDTATPRLRSEVWASAAAIVTCSPTRMGSRRTIPSIDAVTTGLRQWRAAATTPTTSIHSRILPARR